jgi:hypothetical protein
MGDAQARDKVVNLHMIHTLCADRHHVPWFCLSGLSFVYLVRGA